MSDAAAVSARPAPRRRPWLLAGGALSVALSFLPLLGPLIQVATLAASIVAGARGTADRLWWIGGAIGAGAGLLMSFALEYLLVV